MQTTVTVQERSRRSADPGMIEIYSAAVCPFAQRTRMVLLEKGLDFTLTEIDLRNRPDWFLTLSPYGKVPVLKRGSDLVYESAVINEYLEEVYRRPALMPADPGRRAQARIWIDYCNTQYVPNFYKLLLAQDPGEQARLREKLIEKLRFLDREGLGKLQGEGPYWLGKDISLVDITYYPFFERFCVAEHYRDARIPGDCARLRDWFETMRTRESAKATGNPASYYIRAYAAYADGSIRSRSADEARDR